MNNYNASKVTASTYAGWTAENLEEAILNDSLIPVDTKKDMITELMLRAYRAGMNHDLP